jgi:RHS repeat-associated protein
MTAEYVWLGDMPLAKIDSAGTIAYIHPDHLNTPQKMTDATQAIVFDRVQQPFGESVGVTGAGTNNLRFPGQYADSESLLNYNLMRDYDPTLGRYIESDPIGLVGGISLYGYAGQNPVRGMDPLGLYCKSFGGTTVCQDIFDHGPEVSFPTPAGFPAFFNSASDNYHHYDKQVSGSKRCSDLMSAIINNPTPGGSNSPATLHGTLNNATPPNFWAQIPSPVMSYLATDSNGNPVVINVTEPNHPLWPGYVVRTITSNSNGGIMVHNYGEGLGVLQSFGPLSDYFINDAWIGQTQGLMNSCGCGN